MKIAPGPPLPLPARQQPQPGEPPRTGIGDARAARFAEFGMFGPEEPPPAPRPAILRAPAIARRPAAQAGPGVQAPPTLADPSTSPAEAPLDRPHLPTDEATARPAHRAPSLKTASDEACSLPEAASVAAVEIEEPAGPQSRPRAVQPRLRQAAPVPAVSLSLREENGAVEIVAGSTPIDPESRVLLRRLVEVMLARSGLALAHFQLNGAPLAPDSLGRTGGLHGTRTR